MLVCRILVLDSQQEFGWLVASTRFVLTDRVNEQKNE